MLSVGSTDSPETLQPVIFDADVGLTLVTTLWMWASNQRDLAQRREYESVLIWDGDQDTCARCARVTPQPHRSTPATRFRPVTSLHGTWTMPMHADDAPRFRYR